MLIFNKKKIIKQHIQNIRIFEFLKTIFLLDLFQMPY